jgi:FkbM family methyltransferase
MNLMIKKMLHGLPAPVLGKLRFVRDQLAIRSFRPKIVEHSYGGIHLRVRLADSMSARWYDSDSPELPEITFLKRRKLKSGSLVFDLGAHQGVVALRFASIVGPSGRVVAVEGGRRNFDLAMENKHLNKAENLCMLHAVVASESGIPVSFSDEINGCVNSSGTPVISRSIDALTSEYGTPEVVILDLEGYECRALAGATQTLKAGADWCVEVHAGCGLESFGGSAEQVVQVFQDCGYDLYCYAGERDEVHAMSTIPQGRFFLIATQKRVH